MKNVFGLLTNISFSLFVVWQIRISRERPNNPSKISYNFKEVGPWMVKLNTIELKWYFSIVNCLIFFFSTSSFILCFFRFQSWSMRKCERNPWGKRRKWKRNLKRNIKLKRVRGLDSASNSANTQVWTLQTPTQTPIGTLFFRQFYLCKLTQRFDFMWFLCL